MSEMKKEKTAVGAAALKEELESTAISVCNWVKRVTVGDGRTEEINALPDVIAALAMLTHELDGFCDRRPLLGE